METKDKLRNAALDLFSERGFHATTIGNIENAAGLAPRAGTFYRHYQSKKALFDECIWHFVETVGEEFDPGDTLLLNDPRAELIVIAQTMMRVAKEQRKIRLLVRQNVGQQPQLLKMMNDVNDWFFTEKLAGWAKEKLKRAGRDDDPITMAALIFGPILYHMLQVDIAAYSYGMDERKFLTSWADHWAGALAVKPAT